MQPSMENPTAANGGVPKNDLAGRLIASEFNSSHTENQTFDLARSVFGRRTVVVHEPIRKRFRPYRPGRIRRWRAF
jgi:hypothetical protein